MTRKSFTQHIKHTASALAFIILMLATSSCTHNNGDIDFWFGTWHLESVEANGTTLSDYDGSMFFMFQNKVANVRQVLELHDYVDHFASFTRNDDGSIDINFPDERFTPPYSIGMQLSNHLTVVSHSGSNLILSSTVVISNPTSSTTTTATYHYHLHKQP